MAPSRSWNVSFNEFHAFVIGWMYTNLVWCITVEWFHGFYAAHIWHIWLKYLRLESFHQNNNKKPFDIAKRIFFFDQKYDVVYSIWKWPWEGEGSRRTSGRSRRVVEASKYRCSAVDSCSYHYRYDSWLIGVASIVFRRHKKRRTRRMNEN